MESSALPSSKTSVLPRPRLFAPLRLQSDERLVTLVRAGNESAFDVLVDRYTPRLLAFCRYMLRSDSDAEDLLQETFVAAYSAINGDAQPIHVQRWLYTIARNRCLNHLRHLSYMRANGATSEPVDDALETYPAGMGISTAERVARREDFRSAMQDLRSLPEAQRTALVLREIHGLTYENTAEVMGTTVPSVKSLLVRARVSMVEDAQGRELACKQVRWELAHDEQGFGHAKGQVRSHLRRCSECKRFKLRLRTATKTLAALAPVWPLATAKSLFVAKLGPAITAGGAGASTGGGSIAVGVSAGSASLAGTAALGLVTLLPLGAGAGEMRTLSRDRPPPAVVAPAPAVTAPAPRRVSEPAGPPNDRRPGQTLPSATDTGRPTRDEKPSAPPAPVDGIEGSEREVAPGIAPPRHGDRSAPGDLSALPRGRPAPAGVVERRSRPAPGSPTQNTFDEPDSGSTPQPAPPAPELGNPGSSDAAPPPSGGAPSGAPVAPVG